MRIFLLLTFLFYLRLSTGFAQPALALTSPTDTVKITLAEAENLFQERNLPLLQQKTSIESARAAIIQARLFENPVLSLEQNIYNSKNGKYFDASRTGQQIVAVEQLITLAGKRKKRVRVEEYNAQLTEAEYFDLLRALRFNLRSSFAELHFQLQINKSLTERVAVVQKLVTAFEGQYKKGNVPLKEITRLKALLISLDNQQLKLQAEIQENQSELRLLTHSPVTTFLVPQPDQATIQTLNLTNLTYPELVETAKENRYDLKGANTNVNLHQANLKLQKSLAVPDVTLGGLYDRDGSFIRNYTGVTLQMPLPLWNRNQGNIKIARHELERSQLGLQYQEQVVENEVMEAYQKALKAQQLHAGFDPNFHSDFNKLFDGVAASFARRNLSLLEFLDYFEAYSDSLEQGLELENTRLRTLEEINYAVGKPVFSY
ncbi:TolC family protein [Adhaeribacter sp. BT258]|uniref:TolC family protein n=1 Tax=Adhaeribacter terrigena TaxID=2793070 RepID=A0ABS1C393_9BACT|nr:TolC family protein [Adhaeribacter terrigena]MBK0403832.1 TolC family protein [Adhaeribacter terrigena]